MATNESVTNLLDGLCRSLYRDFGGRDGEPHPDGIDAKFLRRCRCVAYERLLKMTPVKLADLGADQLDPIKQLRYCQFECDLQVGLAKSLEFSNYGLFNANSSYGRQMREHKTLVSGTLNYLEQNDDEALARQPIVSMLMALANLASHYGSAQVSWRQIQRSALDDD